MLDDPEPDFSTTQWVCICNTCDHEWGVPILPTTDDETGKIVYRRPSFCPECGSLDIYAEAE